MKQAKLWLVLALAGGLMAGCATDKPGGAAVDDKGAGADTSGAAGKGAVSGAAAEDLLAKKRVHFAFDSSTIDADARAIIEAHAKKLSANPSLKIKLEGHCDERGSREYNLGLGERRSKSVEKMMKALGVKGDRINTTSYGEEKPLATGHDEESWRQNRRVELVY